MDQVKKKDILIVEDDAVTAFLSEQILEGHFNTDTVTNGHAALAAVDQKKYDIILMDINLNDATMDGLRTMRLMRYKDNCRKIKIVAVTAISDAREWYIEHGFNELIIKPIKLEDILQLINNLPGSIERDIKKEL